MSENKYFTCAAHQESYKSECKFDFAEAINPNNKFKNTIHFNNDLMSKTIRAKFNVAEICHFGNGGGTKVTMLPVVGNNEENKSFLSLENTTLT